MRDDLHESILQKPNRYLMAAQREIELEDELRNHAQKRGVSQEELRRTAKAITRDARCIKSIYDNLTMKKKKGESVNLIQQLIH